MSGPNSPWWNGPEPRRDFTLKVERTGRPPLPWTWEIISEGGKVGAQRSVRGYGCAEDAWAAGRAVLAMLMHGSGPER
jgi:hypothetical protein